MVKEVIFKVNSTELGTLVVDIKNKRIIDKSFNNIKFLSIAVPEIYEINYKKLEEFFQFRLDNPIDDLEEILNDIQENGFFAAYQHNLRVVVKDKSI